MLISFTASNFRSIRTPQTFSFATSCDRTDISTHCVQTGLRSIPQLSKAAVLFGPNGSGKSNFISALTQMRDMVLHSTSLTKTEFSNKYTPFALGQSEVQPTAFVVDLLLGALRYRYAFSYNSTQICSERLEVCEIGKFQRWFDRSTDLDHRTIWAPFSQHFRGPRNAWREATRGQSLFITAGSVLDSEQLAPLFHWFDQGIESLGSTTQSAASPSGDGLRDRRRREQLLVFLRSAGVQVDDVRVSPSSGCSSHIEPLQFDDARREWLHFGGGMEFSHVRENGSARWIKFADESTGIQRLARLFITLTSAIQGGQLVLADEFDLGLHPLVARHLLTLIHGRAVLHRDAQMLLTSQNSTLMDTRVLRRDEIWLMQLNEARASELHRVSDSAAPPRKGEAIGKQYLHGRYGAIPSVAPYSSTISI